MADSMAGSGNHTAVGCWFRGPVSDYIRNQILAIVFHYSWGRVRTQLVWVSLMRRERVPVRIRTSDPMITNTAGVSH